MINEQFQSSNQENLAYVSRYPTNTGRYFNNYIPFTSQSRYSDRQCDLQQMKQQIGMINQKTGELERSIFKVKKHINLVSVRLPKPPKQKRTIEEGDQISGVKSDKPKGKRQLKQLRRLDIIRKFETESRCGVTFSTFCQMNCLSERTVRRWINDK